MVGYPLRGALASGANVTVGNVSALAGPGDDRRLIQITAPVQPGNSGGPVLDSAGNAVGVAVAKLDAAAMARATGDIPQNVNFAVSARAARALPRFRGRRLRNRAVRRVARAGRSGGEGGGVHGPRGVLEVARISRTTLADGSAKRGLTAPLRTAGPPRHATLPWQCLYFRPEPQGQGALRPTLLRPPGRPGGAEDGGAHAPKMGELDAIAAAARAPP